MNIFVYTIEEKSFGDMYLICHTPKVIAHVRLYVGRRTEQGHASELRLEYITVRIRLATPES